MDTITYDGVAQTVTIQAPTPAPVTPAPAVYGLAACQANSATQQSNMDNVDARVAALTEEKAGYATEKAKWDGYAAGIIAAEPAP
jgi:hypothetical protein